MTETDRGERDRQIDTKKEGDRQREEQRRRKGGRD
jgi:hypothetical protein